jgi:hypothetical protein
MLHAQIKGNRFRQAPEISPARFDPDDDGRKKSLLTKKVALDGRMDQLNCHFAQMSPPPLHFLCVNRTRTKKENGEKNIPALSQKLIT